MWRFPVHINLSNSPIFNVEIHLFVCLIGRLLKETKVGIPYLSYISSCLGLVLVTPFSRLNLGYRANPADSLSQFNPQGPC